MGQKTDEMEWRQKTRKTSDIGVRTKMEEEKMWDKNRSVKQVQRRKRRRRGICVVYVLY